MAVVVVSFRFEVTGNIDVPRAAAIQKLCAIHYQYPLARTNGNGTHAETDHRLIVAY